MSRLLEKKAILTFLSQFFFKLEKDTGIKKIVLIGKCPQERKTSRKCSDEKTHFYLLLSF